jgi:glycolate oxidase FAD binding subunit
MLGAKSILEELSAIVGAANLRAGASGDAAGGRTPRWVVEPETEQQLAAVLSCANNAGLAVIPRGGATKMDWGNPPQRADLILSTVRLNRIVEHAWADLTVTVEAGCTLQSLQTTLARHGQRLAFDGLRPDSATIGGILSTNDSGALRLRFGSLRDLIIGVTIALPDGTLASSGGKVVKNVAGYDLPKLVTGAFGTLGVITRAVFRLHPLCPNSSTVTFSAANWEDMQAKLHAIQDSKLAHSAFQIRAESGNAPQADVLFEATEAGLAAQSEQLQKILGATPISSTPYLKAWEARNGLFSSLQENSVIAKFSVLPSDIANSLQWLERIRTASSTSWQVVVQAIGIGLLRLDADASTLSRELPAIRNEFERACGSFVLLHRPRQLRSLDAWGSPGDALPLMRAVKQRLDPRTMLNPGCYVGGI